jgi:hypothetical protein
VLERQAAVADHLPVGTNPRKTVLMMMGALLVLTPALAVAIEAAGHDVAVGVTFAAIAVLVISYGRIGVAMTRGFTQSETEQKESVARINRWVRFHMFVVLGFPLVVMAAHPWGIETIVVAAGGLAAQGMFLNVMVLAGHLAKRRAQRAQSS